MAVPATIYYPIADNAPFSTDWAFTGDVTGYGCVDEVVSDGDTTYISRDGLVPHTGVCALKIQPVTDPGRNDGFVVQVVAKRRAGAAGAVTMNVDLYQGDPMAGGTLLEAKTVGFSAATYATGLGAYSAAAIAAVTDFTDLWIRIDFTTGLSRTYGVTKLCLSAPASPGPTGDTIPTCGAG